MQSNAILTVTPVGLTAAELEAQRIQEVNDSMADNSRAQ